MIFLSSFSLASLAGFIENSQKPIKIKKLEEKAKVVIANKNYAQTINLYTQIINLNPPDLINFLFKRANIYKLQKDYINCLKDYNNILQIDPYEALVYADKFVKLSPSKESYYIQGVILKELERYQDALKSFDKSIEICYNSLNINFSFRLSGITYLIKC